VKQCRSGGREYERVIKDITAAVDDFCDYVKEVLQPCNKVFYA